MDGWNHCAAGEIFSYNKAVGERTEARGFVPGIMIDNGVLKKDLGGGVSQVATTTWNAAWFSGLELVQHKPHSFYISRYPAGRESTVAWPNVDVKFKNNSGHPIFVDTSFTNSSVTVSIYGTKFADVSSESGPKLILFHLKLMKMMQQVVYSKKESKVFLLALIAYSKKMKWN